ncbi:MAG: 50S ribosomal protein L3, partial [Candidatus Eremiobacteraeota bacterium]|nr:50S ribosomal protein L3 [Candidatus Eremiobacteraeota bacterium]
MKNILGRKVGMTSVFTADGRAVPVTVIAAGPCTIVERKTRDQHGYDAVALGFEPVKRNRVSKPLGGHFKKLGLEPFRFVREFREDTEGEVGQSVTVTGFEPGDRVDVSGISKGHGFSGGIKRHNFSGGGASHGSMIHRQPASNGDTNAGRTTKG